MNDNMRGNSVLWDDLDRANNRVQELEADLAASQQQIENFQIAISNLATTNLNTLNDLAASKAELARLREANRWIPVGERLPEKNGRYDTYGFWGEYFYGDYDAASKAWSVQGVTHWRGLSLPPPPDGDA